MSKPVDRPTIDQLREQMDKLGNAVEAIKIAYLNGTPYGETVPTVDDVRSTAEAYVKAHHAFQRARFGKVRVRMSVAELLR
jgi:tetrahydromethanopterin S-methyltransferase subunit B